MKTAIIFAGFFRTFDVVKETLREHVLEPLNCDVFFVAPKTMFANPSNEIPEYHHIYSQNTNLVDIKWFGSRLKSYNLIDHDAKKYKDLITANNISEITYCGQYSWRILSYMHNISLSVKLFNDYVENNNINYDAVILTRPDIKYYKSIDYSFVNFTKLNYALHSVVEGKVGTSIPYNDQMVIASPSIISIYSNLYDNVLAYHKNDGTLFNSEIFCRTHINKHGIECIDSDFTLYELWRKLEY